MNNIIMKREDQIMKQIFTKEKKKQLKNKLKMNKNIINKTRK